MGAFDTLEARIMALRQGSLRTTAPAQEPRHQPSHAHPASAVEQAQPQMASQDALPSGDALHLRGMQAESVAPDSTRADTRAALASHETGGCTADLQPQPQPERTTTSDNGSVAVLQPAESPQDAAHSGKDGGAPEEGMSMDSRTVAAHPDDTSRGAHALGPTQELDGEPEDWRVQQQRWLETLSGLAETAGLPGKSESHSRTVPASGARSGLGAEERLPSSGGQERHPQKSTSLSKVNYLLWL